MNQRRGFQSNRRTDKGAHEKEAGALKTAIKELRERMAQEGARTVGEWLWRRCQKKQSVRARYHKERQAKEDGKTRLHKYYDLYIDRQMIADEFDALWAKQAALNPTLFTEDKRAALRDTLLHQRPLRPVDPGRCTLLPDEKRAPVALPSAQRFRILQEVNHLRVLDAGLQEVPLTPEQRDTLVELLEKNPALKIELGGHTDNVGRPEDNQRLSEQRAKAVYDYIVGKGVAANRLTYKGYGETQPVATNDTEEGRGENRRTEIKVL